MVRTLFVRVAAVAALVALVSVTPAAAQTRTPTSKDQCKHGGWQNLADETGRPFPNQGRCVSWAIHHPAPLVGLADLAGSFSFTGDTSFVGQFPGCGGDIHQVFDVAYSGSPAVGTVALHIEGCLSPALTSLMGTFTISTNVGTLNGTASGPITFTAVTDFELSLTVTSGTGAFQGTTGVLHATLIWDGPPSTVLTGSVTSA
jgi:hypothetical protein